MAQSSTLRRWLTTLIIQMSELMTKSWATLLDMASMSDLQSIPFSPFSAVGWDTIMMLRHATVKDASVMTRCVDHTDEAVVLLAYGEANLSHWATHFLPFLVSEADGTANVKTCRDVPTALCGRHDMTMLRGICQ